MSVKSKKNVPYTQCPHPRKIGEFCGIHHKAKCVIRIDTAINASSGRVPPVILPNSAPVTPGQVSTASSATPSTAGSSATPSTGSSASSSTALSATVPTCPRVTAVRLNPHNLPRLPQPFVQQSESASASLHYGPEDLPLTCTTLGSSNYWKRIFHSCLYYKIDLKGAPANFVSDLTNWLLTSWISQDEMRGPGLKLHLGPLFENSTEDPRSALKYAKNQTEFYDMIPITEIPLVYLFSFEEQKQQKQQNQQTQPQPKQGEQRQEKEHISELERNLYVCDLRSLHQIMLRTDAEETDNTPSHLRNKPKNPYTNVPFTAETLINYRKRVFLLQQNHITLDYPEDVIEPEKRYELKILEIFQKIYHFGWHVDHRWYLELDPGHVLRRRLYFCLEDLWNYRLSLTKSEKLNVVPHKIFSNKEKIKVDRMTETELKSFLVERIEDLVTKGSSKDDRTKGAMYFLLAFIQVSRPAALALPGLCWTIDYSPNSTS